MLGDLILPDEEGVFELIQSLRLGLAAILKLSDLVDALDVIESTSLTSESRLRAIR